MRNLTLLFFISSLLITFSCRKDTSIELPETNGNLLIIELDEYYNVLGGKELTVGNLSISGAEVNLNIISSEQNWNLLIANSNDTIISLRNGDLKTPELSQMEILSLKDDRLYNELNILDIHQIEEFELDNDLFIKSIGNINLIHSYLSKEFSSKLNVLKLVINEFDPELQLTIPHIRYFVLLGYEV